MSSSSASVPNPRVEVPVTAILHHDRLSEAPQPFADVVVERQMLGYRRRGRRFRPTPHRQCPRLDTVPFLVEDTRDVVGDLRPRLHASVSRCEFLESSPRGLDFSHSGEARDVERFNSPPLVILHELI